MEDAITLAIVKNVVSGDLTFQELYDKTLKECTNGDSQDIFQTDEIVGVILCKMTRGTNPLICRDKKEKLYLTTHGQQFFGSLLRKKQEQINNLLEKLTSVNIKNHELV